MAAKDEMRLVQAKVEPETFTKLRIIAFRAECSNAELIRIALDNMITQFEEKNGSIDTRVGVALA